MTERVRFERFEPGDRVGAISHTDDEGNLHFFGWGTYLGERQPPKGTPGLWGLDAGEGPPNPCIRLDSGRIVWGCQCWWGGEKRIQGALAAAPKVVDATPPDNPAIEGV